MPSKMQNAIIAVTAAISIAPFFNSGFLDVNLLMPDTHTVAINATTAIIQKIP